MTSVSLPLRESSTQGPANQDRYAQKTCPQTGDTSQQLYSYSSDDIKQMLPHRWPMLMIDRAHNVHPGLSGEGIKAVSINEPYFAGHYPDHSIMPGVMIVEALAQLIAVIYIAEHKEAAAKATEQSARQTTHQVTGSPDDGATSSQLSQHVGYLGSINKMKFSRLVVPGDVLNLSARLGARYSGLREAQVRATVDRKVVAAGTLIVTERLG
ncbi:3-hydroxyacyl-ACP dehydratase FabZ [Devriesea agamarum]|uniref:3-hydroxyacyl-ACP dehydratase FabZ n=1 Tax=Devriesea agamarum TaxID=472569 RepID=UPI000A02B736|nr:3-hydroxyacyl-ACP dehydratase FabZ [Devriesea agamarum]